jgi:N6-L-threonylcarbamoyladenine synthase
MVTLGIETSCDETAVGVCNDGTILANVVSSQVVHSRFGGVVPELAARNHIKVISPITTLALDISKQDLSNIDLFAVTYGPGLIGALLVGLSFAKSLAISLNRPFIGVNHLEGHLYALHTAKTAIEYPMLMLLVSGGHTEIVEITEPFVYRTVGKTLDDACGEAFDKVAKLMGLPYPGGPYIERYAAQGDSTTVKLPIPSPKPFHFSYAGLKTAVLYYTREYPEYRKEDVAAAFQEAALEHLIQVVDRAINELPIQSLGVVGGVSANTRLRDKCMKVAKQHGIKLLLPDAQQCTDNGAMIALAGAERYKRFGPSPLHLDAIAREPMDDISVGTRN